MELISYEDLEKKIKEINEQIDTKEGKKYLCKLIDEELHHIRVNFGLWIPFKIEGKDKENTFYCSRCLFKVYHKSLFKRESPAATCDYFFCPNCGSEMSNFPNEHDKYEETEEDYDDLTDTEMLWEELKHMHKWNRPEEDYE